jgi:hydroxymethylbilane synthase
MHTPSLRLGTRSSALARWQAQWVASQLEGRGVNVELVPITTTGDRQAGPIQNIGAQGLFTKELQAALLEERIDLAVHSLKDLPTDVVPGLCLACVPQRAAVGDVLVSPKYPSFDRLPPAAVVGTGSLRRRAQLLNVRGDLQMQDIRGNVETRLRKVDEGTYDAIVLAEAGLRRLRLDKNITELLPMAICLPAIGQGALGLEIRQTDQPTLEAVEPLNHAPSLRASEAERAMLAALRGGCMAPIAAWARMEDDHLTLTGRVLDSLGKEKIEATLTAHPDAAIDLGRRVADELLDQGAARLIEGSRDGV